MEKPSNIVFGSTGLIGRKLVEKLSENENINTTAIVRKSVHYFPKNINRYILFLQAILFVIFVIYYNIVIF